MQCWSLKKMHCKWFWLFVFHLLPTCVGSHSSGEKKKVYFNSDFAWQLNIFCFDFQFEAILRPVLRLRLVRWMHKAVLVFKAAQHKLKQVLPKLTCSLAMVLAGREFVPWKYLTLLPNLHLICFGYCRRFAAGPCFAAQGSPWQEGSLVVGCHCRGKEGPAVKEGWCLSPTEAALMQQWGPSCPF